MFPEDVSIVRPGGRWRSQLCLRNSSLLSIWWLGRFGLWNDTVRWQIDPLEDEREQITLLARLDNNNRSFLFLGLAEHRPSKEIPRLSDGPLAASRGTSR